MNQLAGRKQIQIGYLGGSITQGAGASFPEKTSWRARVTDWFRGQYPQSEIHEINAALGGTGSDLGVFRLGLDLLAFHPDIVFIEFLVNDHQKPPERTVRSLEGIVRQIWLANPQTQIIFVSTITWSLVTLYLRDETPAACKAHQQVAAHYGIPLVPAGQAFLDRYQKATNRWDELTVDDVHPSDLGYQIYADEVIRSLSMRECLGAVCPPAGLPPPLCVYPLEKARVVPASQICAPGWTYTDQPFAGHLAGRLACEKAGTRLLYPFEGTTVGVYWLVSNDSGDVLWSVDGKREQKASSWDEWAQQFTRPHYAILTDSLQPGMHTLSLKILKEHALRSVGTWIRLGGILVG